MNPYSSTFHIHSPTKKNLLKYPQKELLLLLTLLYVGGLAFDDDIFNLRKCFHYTYSLTYSMRIYPERAFYKHTHRNRYEIIRCGISPTVLKGQNAHVKRLLKDLN
jgi:hypothetical protein